MPSGFTLINSVIFALKVIRGSNAYAYSNDGTVGATYLTSSNKVVFTPNEQGISLCAGKSVAVIVAKVE